MDWTWILPFKKKHSRDEYIALSTSLEENTGLFLHKSRANSVSEFVLVGTIYNITKMYPNSTTIVIVDDEMMHTVTGVVKKIYGVFYGQLTPEQSPEEREVVWRDSRVIITSHPFIIKDDLLWSTEVIPVTTIRAVISITSDEELLLPIKLLAKKLKNGRDAFRTIHILHKDKPWTNGEELKFLDALRYLHIKKLLVQDENSGAFLTIDQLQNNSDNERGRLYNVYRKLKQPVPGTIVNPKPLWNLEGYQNVKWDDIVGSSLSEEETITSDHVISLGTDNGTSPSSVTQLGQIPPPIIHPPEPQSTPSISPKSTSTSPGRVTNRRRSSAQILPITSSSGEEKCSPLLEKESLFNPLPLSASSHSTIPFSTESSNTCVTCSSNKTPPLAQVSKVIIPHYSPTSTSSSSSMPQSVCHAKRREVPRKRNVISSSPSGSSSSVTSTNSNDIDTKRRGGNEFIFREAMCSDDDRTDDEENNDNEPGEITQLFIHNGNTQRPRDIHLYHRMENESIRNDCIEDDDEQTQVIVSGYEQNSFCVDDNMPIEYSSDKESDLDCISVSQSQTTSRKTKNKKKSNKMRQGRKKRQRIVTFSSSSSDE